MISVQERVARQFQAEMLTKSWLMAVRRGWLSLLHPTISDWHDVLRAFDKLVAFVDKLEEQIRLVRLSPSMVNSESKERPNKLRVALKKLRDQVLDLRGKAQHWMRVATHTTRMPLGTFTPEDAERMFELYRTKFHEMLEVQVQTRPDPSKGRWNKTRNGHLTELFDDVLGLLRAEAAEIEEARKVNPERIEKDWGQSAESQFDLYGMKVVIDDRTVNSNLAKKYVRLFDETYHMLKAKKLDRVWYGTIFVKCDECGGVNPNGSEYGVGGDYPYGPDVVNIYQRPSHGVVELLAHELGHRYWFKFMHEGQRRKFESLLRVKTDPVVDPRRWESKTQAARKELGTFIDYLPSALKRLKEDLSKADKFVTPPDAQVTPDEMIADALQHATLTDSMQYVEPPNLVEFSSPGLLGGLPKNAYEDAVTAQQKLTAHLEALKDIPGVGQYEPLTARDNLRRVYHWIDVAWELQAGYLTHALMFLDQVENAMKRQVSPEDRRPVLPVSTYGASNESEAFAEAFSYYVTEKEMTRDQLESFRSVLSSMQARVVARYLQAK
jgi:hypothetical protein